MRLVHNDANAFARPSDPINARARTTEFGSRLVQKFGYLANGLQSNDFKPTNQQLAVQKDLEDRLKASQGQLGEALNRELASFNDMLRRANLPNVVSQLRRPTSQEES